jgi:hypothetical protein
LPDKRVLEPNHPKLVEFREKINDFQKKYESNLESGDLTPVEYSYKHYFTEIHSEFGAALYAREMKLPKGAVVIGKIHKHPTMNVLLKGKVSVVTENGGRVIDAPCIYVSDPGVKRVGYVLEDCLWVNILMTKHVGEENLDLMEEAHTASSYKDMGLVDSLDALPEK